jgi:hypothetical protein
MCEFVGLQLKGVFCSREELLVGLKDFWIWSDEKRSRDILEMLKEI